MRWWLAIPLLVGCRQLLELEGAELAERDAAPTEIDAPVVIGHDEDHDFVDDLADNCPTVANTDQVSSEQGIGLACDPNPARDGDSLALVLTFYPAGVPGYVSATGTMFLDDFSRISDGIVTTTGDYAPTLVAAELALVGLPNPGFTVAIELGAEACTIVNCAMGACLRAQSQTAFMGIALPVSARGVLSLAVKDANLVCAYSDGDTTTTASLPVVSMRALHAVRVIAEDLAIDMHSLVVYTSTE